MLVLLVLDIEKEDEKYDRICEALEKLEYSRILEVNNWSTTTHGEAVFKDIVVFPFNVWCKRVRGDLNLREEYEKIRRELNKHHFYGSIHLFVISGKILECRRFLFTES